MSNLAKGLSLVFAAAVCGGAFALPMKFMRRFKWENTWLWASFTTMIAIPLVLGNLILPRPLPALCQQEARPSCSLWCLDSAGGWERLLSV